jgi:hypothetical protein
MGQHPCSVLLQQLAVVAADAVEEMVVREGLAAVEVATPAFAPGELAPLVRGTTAVTGEQELLLNETVAVVVVLARLVVLAPQAPTKVATAETAFSPQSRAPQLFMRAVVAAVIRVQAACPV